MAIIRWDPFMDLITVREKMNHLFEEAVISRGEDKDLVSSSWTPLKLNTSTAFSRSSCRKNRN